MVSSFDVIYLLENARMFKNVFGSGFLVRAAHVSVTWVVTLIIFLHDTDLRKQEEKGELKQPVLYVLLILVSLLLYFVVSLMDPGFVLSDSDVKFTLAVSDEEQEMIPHTSKALRQRRCGYCLLKQPMRSKHCHNCKRCVRRYDHHCPWIENCVGERNHRWFVLYLGIQLLALLWSLNLVWSGFSYAPTWELWLRQNGFLLAATSLVSGFSLVVVLLLGCHLYLVSINTTTWEFMSRYRITYLKHCGAEENPFDQGMLRNLWGFFCVCRTVVWEQVYFRESSEIV